MNCYKINDESTKRSYLGGCCRYSRQREVVPSLGLARGDGSIWGRGQREGQGGLRAAAGLDEEHHLEGKRPLREEIQAGHLQ